jgi:act minimal PKS acyl carrier protein
MGGTVPDLTIADLAEILRECAGVEETVDIDGDIADVPFADLGYDSLAVMEAASRLSRDYGVRLADEVVLNASTPGELLRLANSQIAAAT